MIQVGYVRHTGSGPTREEQIAALRQAGAETLVVDNSNTITGAQQALQSILERMKAGDVLVVWQLDRLGRSVHEVLSLVTQLRQKQISLHSLQDHIQTNAPEGEAQLRVFVALAQCSRTLSRERTQGGIRAARARGNRVGRPRAISPELVKQASDMIRNRDENITVEDIAAALGIAPSTLYRYIGPNGEIRIP